MNGGLVMRSESAQSDRWPEWAGDSDPESDSEFGHVPRG